MIKAELKPKRGVVKRVQEQQFKVNNNYKSLNVKTPISPISTTTTTTTAGSVANETPLIFSPTSSYSSLNTDYSAHGFTAKSSDYSCLSQLSSYETQSCVQTYSSGGQSKSNDITVIERTVVENSCELAFDMANDQVKTYADYQTLFDFINSGRPLGVAKQSFSPPVKLCSNRDLPSTQRSSMSCLSELSRPSLIKNDLEAEIDVKSLLCSLVKQTKPDCVDAIQHASNGQPDSKWSSNITNDEQQLDLLTSNKQEQSNSQTDSTRNNHDSDSRILLEFVNQMLPIVANTKTMSTSIKTSNGQQVHIKCKKPMPVVHMTKTAQLRFEKSKVQTNKSAGHSTLYKLSKFK
jgi:hypothetical protein